jgi:hypothetical protein
VNVAQRAEVEIEDAAAPANDLTWNFTGRSVLSRYATGLRSGILSIFSTRKPYEDASETGSRRFTITFGAEVKPKSKDENHKQETLSSSSTIRVDDDSMKKDRLRPKYRLMRSIFSCARHYDLAGERC